MAVELPKHPAAWQCETCDCVDGIAPEKRWQTKGHIDPTDICYRQAVTNRSIFLVSLFGFYQDGHLYRDGGVSNQPAVYTQAMTFLRWYLSVSKD